MLSRIDHVGIAVRDLDEAIRIYEGRLGLRSTGRVRLEREGIEIAMIPIGESRIELIMPLNPESSVEKFLHNRGEAVHHVAYATDDVGASLAQAGAAGAQLLDAVARPGAHGTRIGFVHPKSVCGVLTEFEVVVAFGFSGTDSKLGAGVGWSGLAGVGSAAVLVAPMTCAPTLLLSLRSCPLRILFARCANAGALSCCGSSRVGSPTLAAAETSGR